MYINFTHLISKGYEVIDFINLIAIHQKETLFIESSIDSDKIKLYEDKKLVEYVKSGGSEYERIRLSTLGKAFLDQCTTRDYSDDIGRLATKLQDMYREYGVDEIRLGKHAQIVSDIIWFYSNTIFNLGDIYNGILEYIDGLSSANELAYVKGLQNIFWEPRNKNIFAIHRTLQDSKLFELLCNSHGNKSGEFLQGALIPNTEKEKSHFKYMNTLRNLQIPTGLADEMYITGSRASDIKAKKRILPMFINYITQK